jgi:hypothetical protein
MTVRLDDRRDSVKKSRRHCDRFGHLFQLQSHGIGVAEPWASDSFIDASMTAAGSPASSYPH